MARLALALLLVVAAVPGSFLGAALTVAWIRRRALGWSRSTKAFSLKQVRPLTAARRRLTSLAHVASFVIVLTCFRERLQIVEAALLLVIYVVVVSALTLSLFVRMPAFKSLWSDTFSRVVLVGSPFVVGYLMRGYSRMWLDETLGFSSENAPMAHFAGTVMMAGIAAATLLMACGVVFEVAMMSAPLLPSGSKQRRLKRASALGSPSKPAGQDEKEVEQEAESKPGHWAMFRALFWSELDTKAPEARAWRPITRGISLFSMFALSFLGCSSGVFAALSPFNTGFGKVVLKAIAFEFDAAPATRCTLRDEEVKPSQSEQPTLKALMLSTSQEKGILVTRGPHLFDEVTLATVSKEANRDLIVGRTVVCFDPAASAPAR